MTTFFYNVATIFYKPQLSINHDSFVQSCLNGLAKIQGTMGVSHDAALMSNCSTLSHMS